MTFSWTPPGRGHPAAVPRLTQVLYHFDGPKMVLAVDRRGRQLLGVAADEDADATMRWVYAPAPPERMSALLSTRAGLRAFFERGMLEILDVGRSGTAVASWTVAPGDVPDDLLPDVDAALPELSDVRRDALLGEQSRLVEQRSRVAARIAEAVDRTASAPKEEDDRPVVGTLIGFLPTDRRFELQVQDGVIIKGKVMRDADVGNISSFFQKACTAHLHVVTVERLGQTAEAFTLLRVEAAPE